MHDHKRHQLHSRKRHEKDRDDRTPFCSHAFRLRLFALLINDIGEKHYEEMLFISLEMLHKHVLIR